VIPTARVLSQRRLGDDHVILRTIRHEDYDVLYSLLAVPEVALAMRSRGATPSPDDFAKNLWSNVFVQFGVCEIERPRLVGIVGIYNANHRNGTGYLSALSVVPALLTGVVLRGLAILIAYAFENWPFRKLYFESMESSFRHFGSVTGLFEVEGRLRDFEFVDGAFQDVLICSISRNRVSELLDLYQMPTAALGRRRRSLSPISDMDFESFLARLSDIGIAVPVSSEQGGRLEMDSLQIVELVTLIEDATETLVSNEEVSDALRVSTTVKWYELYCIKASSPRLEPGVP
jgi:RimJ/RimL family protein N-acetyltransferase/acyl carrier protein